MSVIVSRFSPILSWIVFMLGLEIGICIFILSYKSCGHIFSMCFVVSNFHLITTHKHYLFKNTNMLLTYYGSPVCAI